MSAVKKGPSLADRYPALAQFLAGYLHQDFVLDHKTPEGARDAFLKDANARERAAVRKELDAFLAESAAQAWGDVRDGFGALGGAWAPKSRAALSAFVEGFQAPRRVSRK